MSASHVDQDVQPPAVIEKRGPDHSPPSSPRSGDSDSPTSYTTRVRGGAATSESDGDVTPRPLKPLAQPQSGSDTESDEEEDLSETEPSTANTGSHSDRSGGEMEHSEADTSNGDSDPDSEQRDRIDCVSAPSVMAPPSVHSLVMSDGEEDRRSLDSAAISHFDGFEAVIVPGPGSTQSSDSGPFDFRGDPSPLRQQELQSPHHDPDTPHDKLTKFRPSLLRSATFDPPRLRHQEHSLFSPVSEGGDRRSLSPSLEASALGGFTMRPVHPRFPERPPRFENTRRSPSLGQRHSPLTLHVKSET